jgi:hypothetical protein
MDADQAPHNRRIPLRNHAAFRETIKITAYFISRKDFNWLFSLLCDS